MKLYKIKIKPQSSYNSLLQSDTFFGAFCWSYKYLYGEENLEQFLREGIEKGPQIVFSNAFPSGFLPLPLGLHDSERIDYGMRDKTSAKLAYQEDKKLKKRSWVAKKTFLKIQNGLREGYSKDLQDEHNVQVSTPHNMVPRDTGTVYHSEYGGNLYTTEEFFADKNEFLDVYMLSSLDTALLQEVLSLMFELGIGAKKSTGKGYFSMMPLENGEFISGEAELMDVSSPNGYIALSNYIPAERDPTQGWYKVLVKYGKLDREYAAGQYPYKKPLLYLLAGSVFRTDDFKPYYGSFVTNVAAIRNVVVNAYTIALPICLPKDA